MSKSSLSKALSGYVYYFSRSGWKKGEKICPRCYEEYSFEKGDQKIEFCEDLREYITLLSIYDHGEQVFCAGFRDLTPKGISVDIFTKISADTEGLTWDLKALGTKNCVEEKEVLAYIRFLKHNGFIL